MWPETWGNILVCKEFGGLKITLTGFLGTLNNNNNNKYQCSRFIWISVFFLQLIIQSPITNVTIHSNPNISFNLWLNACHLVKGVDSLSKFSLSSKVSDLLSNLKNESIYPRHIGHRSNCFMQELQMQACRHGNSV